ncbi:phage terminase large subunit-like protein [Nitrobacteraceae bacterium AZCC 2161]
MCADELHAWPKRDLWEALKTGLLKTPGSLNVIITTAGRGQDTIAHDQYSYARKVALGEIDDPATLPILFEAPADCDWRDEQIWHRVNPGLKHGYPDLAGLRQYAREASNRPGDRESFRQLNLNIWLDHSSDPFVDMATYDLGGGAIDHEALIGKSCWIGVDMSTTTDLTAVVACFKDDDDRFTVVPHFFCPADNLRARSERDGVPYVQWAKDGFITPTPGICMVKSRSVPTKPRKPGLHSGLPAGNGKRFGNTSRTPNVILIPAGRGTCRRISGGLDRSSGRGLRR